MSLTAMEENQKTKWESWLGVDGCDWLQDMIISNRNWGEIAKQRKGRLREEGENKNKKMCCPREQPQEEYIHLAYRSVVEVAKVFCQKVEEETIRMIEDYLKGNSVSYMVRKYGFGYIRHKSVLERLFVGLVENTINYDRVLREIPAVIRETVDNIYSSIHGDMKTPMGPIGWAWQQRTGCLKCWVPKYTWGDEESDI